MYAINFWPVLVAAIAGFIISSLWYSPFLFGKEWMALVKDGKDISNMSPVNFWKEYLAHFVMLLVTFVVVAFAIYATGSSSAVDGASLGFVAWLGFMVPIAVSQTLWTKMPFKLALIDFINNLIVLAIGGAIIGSWV